MSFTVLIIDDSKLARMSAVKALRSLRPDWLILEASNADEALELSQLNKVDMGLLDFNMPGRDGLALAGELRSSDKDLLLALVSANFQEEILRKAANIGAHFLTKPLTDKILAGFLSDVAQHLKSATN